MFQTTKTWLLKEKITIDRSFQDGALKKDEQSSLLIFQLEFQPGLSRSEIRTCFLLTFLTLKLS